MPPETPPLSSHEDLELTRLSDAAGYVFHDGWFLERALRQDYDLLRRHPRPPRSYPWGRRLRRDLRGFASIAWLFTAAVIAWAALTGDPTTGVLGGLLLVMMVAFFYRTTRSLRQGRLLLGRSRKVVGRASLITSTLDRVEVVLHPAAPWPTVDVNVPPGPSRYLQKHGDSYELLLLAVDRPEDVRLMGFRPLPEAGTAAAGPATGSDPS